MIFCNEAVFYHLDLDENPLVAFNYLRMYIVTKFEKLPNMKYERQL